METKFLQQTECNETQKVSYIFFCDFAKSVIQKMKSGKLLTDKGNIYADETIRSYVHFLDKWEAFEAAKSRKFEFQHIFPSLTLDFTVFLQGLKTSKNSQGLILSKLKSLLKMAFLDGLHFWNGSGIKTPKELTTKIYLSLAEIKKINSLQLSASDRMIVDIFLIQCFTGMRYETLLKFIQNPTAYIKEHNGHNYIDITSGKTDEQSVIPIGKIVSDILSRTEKFHVYSEQHINRRVKELAELADINSMIVKRITIAGKQTESLVPKHTQISTHTARRTFVSLAKLSGMSDEEIMPCTGHRNSKQLNEYNRTEKIENVNFQHNFFQISI